MSTEEDKLKHSKRLLNDEKAIKKQLRIAKEHKMTEYNPAIKEPHRYHKHHAMDCGNPGCFLCSNPRRIHKDSLTVQEKSFEQTKNWSED